MLDLKKKTAREQNRSGQASVKIVSPGQSVVMNIIELDPLRMTPPLLMLIKMFW